MWTKNLILSKLLEFLGGLGRGKAFGWVGLYLGGVQAGGWDANGFTYCTSREGNRWTHELKQRQLFQAKCNNDVQCVYIKEVYHNRQF